MSPSVMWIEVLQGLTLLMSSNRTRCSYRLVCSFRQDRNSSREFGLTLEEGFSFMGTACTAHHSTLLGATFLSVLYKHLHTLPFISNSIHCFLSTYTICCPLFSTCFRPHRPIIRRSKLYMQPMVFSRSADVFVVCRGGEYHRLHVQFRPPDDGPVRPETCRGKRTADSVHR